MKTCRTCEKEFKPSSRHADCPACRHKKKKNACACGRLKAASSKNCLLCAAIAQGGPNNGNWKGGTTKHHAGYIMVRAKEHPRGSNNNGYVFEHILVMEEYLNRYLLPGENVHHKNGVRADNRLENLELWVRPQPSGIRAQDALKWAKEVVDRYDNLFPSS